MQRGRKGNFEFGISNFEFVRLDKMQGKGNFEFGISNFEFVRLDKMQGKGNFEFGISNCEFVRLDKMHTANAYTSYVTELKPTTTQQMSVVRRSQLQGGRRANRGRVHVRT